MLRLSVFVALLALVNVASPLVAAQNSPGDECIIQVTLHDNLTTASLAFDLLFDDAAWKNLTDAIDEDQDGVITASEIEQYEHRVAKDVAGEEVPPSRRLNMLVDFDSGAYSGTATATPTAATNATELLNFEGPVEERAGKIVRETWTYRFNDPLTDYDNGRLKTRAYAILLAWGPDAEETPEESVSVIETVQVTAPKGWWIRVDDERHKTYTFQSGDGYSITFVPDTAPREPLLPAPGLGWVAALGVLVAIGTVRRGRRA